MRLLRLFLALLLATPAAAEPGLWRVRDADTEITLFGSIHALPAATQWLTPRITGALDAADMLVLEAIIPDDPAAIGPLVKSLGVRAGLPPLATRVAPSKRAALASSIALSGIPERQLDKMETWLAAITLGDGALAQLGLSPAAGVEPTLTARAKAANKPVIGLETPEFQLRLFDGLSETDQRALLDATVDDLSTARDDTNALIAYWQAGETEALGNDLDKQLRATPALSKILLADRNARWADWIATALQRPGKVFIAVGAGHLAGPDSLIVMLRRKGLTVERLP